MAISTTHTCLTLGLCLNFAVEALYDVHLHRHKRDNNDYMVEGQLVHRGTDESFETIVRIGRPDTCTLLRILRGLHGMTGRHIF